MTGYLQNNLNFLYPEGGVLLLDSANLFFINDGLDKATYLDSAGLE